MKCTNNDLKRLKEYANGSAIQGSLFPPIDPDSLKSYIARLEAAERTIMRPQHLQFCNSGSADYKGEYCTCCLFTRTQQFYEWLKVVEE